MVSVFCAAHLTPMSIISLIIDIGDWLFDSVTPEVRNFYYRSVGNPIDSLPGAEIGLLSSVSGTVVTGS